jgi:hypothetical protein
MVRWIVPCPDGKLDDDGGGEHPVERLRVIELAPVERVASGGRNASGK